MKSQILRVGATLDFYAVRWSKRVARRAQALLGLPEHTATFTLLMAMSIGGELVVGASMGVRILSINPEYYQQIIVQLMLFGASMLVCMVGWIPCTVGLHALHCWLSPNTNKTFEDQRQICQAWAHVAQLIFCVPFLFVTGPFGWFVLPMASTLSLPFAWLGLSERKEPPKRPKRRRRRQKAKVTLLDRLILSPHPKLG